MNKFFLWKKFFFPRILSLKSHLECLDCFAKHLNMWLLNCRYENCFTSVWHWKESVHQRLHLTHSVSQSWNNKKKLKNENGENIKYKNKRMIKGNHSENMKQSHLNNAWANASTKYQNNQQRWILKWRKERLYDDEYLLLLTHVWNVFFIALKLDCLFWEHTTSLEFGFVCCQKCSLSKKKKTYRRTVKI